MSRPWKVEAVVGSSKISVGRLRRVLDALEVVARDEVLDALLDQGHVGLEARSQLVDNLRDEEVVRQLFSLPVKRISD